MLLPNRVVLEGCWSKAFSTSSGGVDPNDICSAFLSFGIAGTRIIVLLESWVRTGGPEEGDLSSCEGEENDEFVRVAGVVLPTAAVEEVCEEGREGAGSTWSWVVGTEGGGTATREEEPEV